MACARLTGAFEMGDPLFSPPHVFVWTASVERILTKVTKCKETLGTLP